MVKEERVVRREPRHHASLELPRSTAPDRDEAPHSYRLSGTEDMLAAYNKSDNESAESKSSHDISSIGNSNDKHNDNDQELTEHLLDYLNEQNACNTTKQNLMKPDPNACLQAASSYERSLRIPARALLSNDL